MKKAIVGFLLIGFSLFLKSCNTTEPPPNGQKPTLELTLEDVSCIEAWIQLKTTNLQLPAEITLKKNNVAQSTILCNGDTLLYIDSLLPNQTYKFQSVIQSINQSGEAKSNELQVTTLTPTSQEFTWQVYSWGMHSSSEIRDIAIVDENNIWCVGEIYLNDSSGVPNPNAFNALRWNGQNWELQRIYHHSSCNPVDYPAFRSIYAFSDTNIVLASSGSIGWFDGKTNKPDCGIRPLLTGAINKLWGSSSNDLYAVGNEGNIAHYNGTTWQKIETGTDINFRDIYGSVNKDNNEIEIIALASNSGINQRKKLVRINNQTVETLPDSGLADYLSTIWFISGRKYCIGGQGYYQSNTFGPVWERDNTIPQFHITSIRGAGLNDIVLGGSFGLLMHYNGVNWMNYAYITASYFDVISEVAIKGNTIVAAGFKGSKAVVMIGKR